MITIFFLIVIIFVIIFFNSKISTLEEKVDSLINKYNSTKVNQSVATPVVPSMAQSSIYGIPTTTTAPTPIPVPMPIADNISKTSGEEQSGKMLGKIGVAAILLAGAFFLKDVPDEGKVGIGILVGLVFIGLGYFLKTKYRGYAHLLMGGGISVLYLSIFAATTLFKMINPQFGFFLMIFITAVAVIISLVEDSKKLAVLSALGGFVTPILITTVMADYTLLLSYLLILDIGILVISAKKKWNILYHTGFWGTVLIYSVWHIANYNLEIMYSVLFFLTAYFIVFLLSSIFHHFIRKEKSSPSDALAISLNAGMYFMMGYNILFPTYHDNLGYFALVLAVVYAITANLSFNVMRDDKILNYFLTGISVVFLSIAVPLQFSNEWITLAWLMEALILYIISFSLGHKALRVFAGVVFSLGIIRVLFYDGILNYAYTNINTHAFVNFGFVLLMISVMIAYVVQYLYHKFDNVEDLSVKKIIMYFVLTANILTVVGITSQIYLYYENSTLILSRDYEAKVKVINNSGGDEYSQDRNDILNQNYATMYKSVTDLNNQRNTVVSVFWIIYAVILIGIGFSNKVKLLRILGLAFFVIIAVKIFFDVWGLGTQYRVISLVVFGVVALLASFGYAKYKDKIIN